MVGRVESMERHFTLEYWVDDGWYVGKLKEVPGVFSQGEMLEELEENFKDAYKETLDEELVSAHPGSRAKGPDGRSGRVNQWLPRPKGFRVCPP